MARLSQLLRSPSVRRAAESFLGGGDTRSRTTTAPRRRGRRPQRSRGGLGGGLLSEVTRQVQRRR